ncbi:MAG: hypothetical protein KKD48_04940 [Nanoarchaeota archaeon]|nr:hypothetical protein [Nanoarchaeota archaeon]
MNSGFVDGDIMNLTLKTKHNLYKIVFERIPKPKVWTTGTGNRTQDGLYCVYLDYDLIEEDYVNGEIPRLQQFKDLGNFHIFSSSEKKYHAMCFSKLTALEFMQILENSSCDEAFKKVPRFVSIRNWILRHFEKGIKPKPKYLYSVLRDSARQESYAHWNFLSELYPELKSYPLTHPDNLNELELITYKTGNL